MSATANRPKRSAVQLHRLGIVYRHLPVASLMLVLLMLRTKPICAVRGQSSSLQEIPRSPLDRFFGTGSGETQDSFNFLSNRFLLTSHSIAVCFLVLTLNLSICIVRWRY